MNAIKMNRLELLGLVQANKVKHIAEFEESVEDYKKLVLQFSTANLKLAKTAITKFFKGIYARIFNNAVSQLNSNERI
jgi:hypothetical protein